MLATSIQEAASVLLASGSIVIPAQRSFARLVPNGRPTDGSLRPISVAGSAEFDH